MEKFGLFDLIDKFNSASSGKNDFSKTRPEEQTEQKKSATGESVLKDPDVSAPPQYMMSAKMAAYMKRHDELIAQIPKRTVKRGRKPKSAQ